MISCNIFLEILVYVRKQYIPNIFIGIFTHICENWITSLNIIVSQLRADMHCYIPIYNDGRTFFADMPSKAQKRRQKRQAEYLAKTEQG